MKLKISLLFSCALLISSTCWAAGKEYSPALQQKLEELSQKSEWKVHPSGVGLFRTKQMGFDFQWESPVAVLMQSAEQADINGLALMLLHESCDIDYTSVYGDFPLKKVLKPERLAINLRSDAQRYACFELLLKCGANQNHEWSPAHFASGDGMGSLSFGGVPLLSKMVEMSNAGAVELLLKYGAHAMALDQYGYSIFYWLQEAYEKTKGTARAYETRQIQKMLELHFFRLLANSMIKWEYRVGSSQDDFMKLWNFLDDHLKPKLSNFLEWRDEDGATLLHRAVQQKCPMIVQILRSYGADMDIKNCHGRTPFDDASLRACHDHDTEILEMLCDSSVTDSDLSDSSDSDVDDVEE